MSDTTPEAVVNFLDEYRHERGSSAAEARGEHDAGNAALFADLHGDRLRYVPLWNEWLVWTGHRWERDPREVRVTELAKDVGRTRLTRAGGLDDKSDRTKAVKWASQSLNANRIKAMIELARGIDGVTVGHEALDASPYLLGVRNGVIDLRSGRFRAGDPADLMTMAAPVDYDPEAEAPRWDKALVEWFPDPDTRAYAQRIAGDALVGSQRDHHLILLYGDGGNGKGTFVRALMAAAGEYATSIHKSLLVETRHEQHDTEKAKLFRCRLAVAAETSKRVALNEASVKNLTGGDRISARRMREDPWEFDPSHSVWLQTNYLPAIAGRDPGIWRRLKVMPWVAHFEGEADRDLDEQLAAEAPGILRWAVEGARLYLAQGLEESEEVKRATLAYRDAEDVFGRFAGDVGLTFSKGLLIASSQLVSTFEEWCRESDVTPRAGELTAWMRGEGATAARDHIEGNRVRVWRGVGIVDPAGEED